MDKLADFKGAVMQGHEMGEGTAKPITSRILELAVPQGSGTAAQREALQKAAEYGEQIGVKLKIVEIP